MAVSKSFQETIKNYLDNYSKENPEFSVKYANEKKSIEECCNFICSEVQKLGVNGLDDDEVYRLARHYYDEEDLGEIKEATCKVITNQKVELSEEEISKAKDQAIQELKNEFKAKEQEKTNKKIEKIKKHNEEIGQVSLFDF